MLFLAIEKHGACHDQINYFDLKKGITSKATYYEHVLTLPRSRKNFFMFLISLLSTLLCLSLKIQNKFNNH